jgi:hypothetical protein
LIVCHPLDAKRKQIRLDCENRIAAFAFGTTHDIVYVIDLDGDVFRWNTATLKKQLLFSMRCAGTYSTVAVSPDGRRLAVGEWSSSKSSESRVWDLAANKEIHRLPKDSRLLAFSPNGKQLVVAADERLLALDSVSFKEQWNTWYGLRSYNSVTFSPDNNFLIVTEFTGRSMMIHLLDPANGKALRAPLSQQLAQSPAGGTYGMPHLTKAVISPNGVLLACSFGEQDCQIWEMATMRKACCLTSTRPFLTSAQPFLNGVGFISNTQLITTSFDGEVFLWDLTRASPFKQFQENTTKGKESAWDALLSLDPLYGVAATEYFRAHPKEFLAFVHQPPLSPSSPPQQRMEMLIQDLDSAVYLKREKARANLIGYGELIEPSLVQALRKNSSLELSRRIQEILSRLPKVEGLGKHAHRQLRVVFLLETIATTECKRILELIERDALDPTVKARAREAILRLKTTAQK